MDYIDSISRVYAPVAQGIEHRPPEAGAAVRIRPGVYFLSAYGGSLYGGKEKRLFCKVQEACAGNDFVCPLIVGTH